MIEQHFRVRAQNVCAHCYGAKETGLLLCWPCHKKLKRKFDGGYGERIDKVLKAFELALAMTENTAHNPGPPPEHMNDPFYSKATIMWLDLGKGKT